MNILESVLNLIVPEEVRVRRLLDFDASVMRGILPPSPVFVKDVNVLFDYQNKVVRLIVKAVKYKNNYSLRKRIASYFYDEIIEISSDISLFEGRPPVLVPMPMSAKEKKQRSFNQCEELCKEIKKLSGGNIEISFNLLKKVKETRRQTGLSREERIENVEGSMIASGEARNRSVIILDDVYTTGATIGEAGRALLAAGASRVLALFLAH